MTIEEIQDIMKRSSDLKAECSRCLAPVIRNVADRLIAALKAGNKICWIGNGGSAADAQHMAAELVGKFYKDRRALPSMVFHGNASSVTAISNDYAYDSVFSRQIEAFVVPNDIVIGISTSGKSKNIIEGFKRARELGATTVAMVGEYSSDVEEYVDYCICVPSSDTPRIQECHAMIGHILCQLSEEAFLNE